jgi:hypothetical protein
MAWREYLNLELLKLTSRHVSGSLGLILGFWLVDVTVKTIGPLGHTLEVVDICEKIVMVSGVLWLTGFVVYELWIPVLKAVGEKLRKIIPGQKILATLAT